MLKKCYDNLNGSYEEAVGRLMNDKLIDRFIVKFLDDESMSTLRSAVAAGDIEGSFKAAHTLKGVAANLAFTRLANAASELTEQLRSQENPADEKLFAEVNAAYDLTVDSIREYEASK